jgi:hypothetical protein
MFKTKYLNFGNCAAYHVLGVPVLQPFCQALPGAVSSHQLLLKLLLLQTLLVQNMAAVQRLLAEPLAAGAVNSSNKYLWYMSFYKGQQ